MTPAAPDRQTGPGTVPPTDRLADLLRRSARGDEEAFAELYDAVAPRLHGLALRVLRNPSLAEEVTQEALVEVWRQSARFDPAKGSPLAWMLTITHRQAVDRVRSVVASTRREEVHAATREDPPYDVTADSAAANLEAERVRRALRGLTEAQRSAVELAFLGGYTHTEVARLLDLPLGTAKTRIRDGLIRLRDTLGVAE